MAIRVKILAASTRSGQTPKGPRHVHDVVLEVHSHSAETCPLEVGKVYDADEVLKDVEIPGVTEPAPPAPAAPDAPPPDAPPTPDAPDAPPAPDTGEKRRR